MSCRKRNESVDIGAPRCESESKTERKKIPLDRRARSTSAVIVLHDQSALIFAGSSCGSSITISVLDISKPTGTHGWTKFISQIIDSLCDCRALVLPCMIRKTESNTNLKRNYQRGLREYCNN
jgi:hypothetical protein